MENQNPISPQVPPRQNNYPIPQNQNWGNGQNPAPANNSPNPTYRNPSPVPVNGPAPVTNPLPSNGPVFNNIQNFNNRPPLQPSVPQRTNVSVVSNQNQRFQMLSQNNQNYPPNSQSPPPPTRQVSNQKANYTPPAPLRQGSSSTVKSDLPPPTRQASNQNTNYTPPAPLRQGSSSTVKSDLPPPRRQYSGNQIIPPPQPPQGFPTKQLTSHSLPGNSNVQVNYSENVQQRRTYSQKETTNQPLASKPSTNSISRSASKLKTKFVDMVNKVPTLSRTLSTRKKQENRRRLSKYGGMNVHSAYRNSLMVKPVFDSKLLLQPQNPNFIISLGIIVMIASVSLAIAMIALKNGGLTENMIHDISNNDSYGFIFFSMFMLIIALTGYISYHTKWTSLLITYSVFIIFGFIVQMIIISLFLNIYFNPVVQMRNKWKDVLSDSEKQLIQENYKCCGFLSVVDHGVTTSMCFPDTGSTTLPVKSGKAMMNSFNYLNFDLDEGKDLRKRQDAGAAPAGGQDAGANQDAGAQAPVNAQDQAQGQDAGAQAPVNAQDQTQGAQGAQGQDQGAGAGAAADSKTPVASGQGNNDAQTLKDLYKKKDPNTFTKEDIREEGCANIIVSAVRTGLIQYILIEICMAIAFIVSLYFAYMHFKEQLAIEKEVDSARATFG